MKLKKNLGVAIIIQVFIEFLKYLKKILFIDSVIHKDHLFSNYLFFIL